MSLRAASSRKGPVVMTSGSAKFDDGTQALPSVAGVNDPDTGLRWGGSNILYVSTNADTAFAFNAYNFRLSSSGFVQWSSGNATAASDTSIGRQSAGLVVVNGGTATPAGGAATMGLVFGSTAGFGVYIGSGAPTLSAAKGSLYLRSDGSTTNDRAYINTNGASTWTALTTAA